MIDLVGLQAKIYELLSTLNYHVYDNIPKDAKCPYIEIGYCDADDDSCKTNNGLEILQYIDIYSDYKGQKEAKEMAQDVNNLMQNNKFIINNSIAFCYLKKMKILKQSDSMGDYTHAILIYKILVKE